MKKWTLRITICLILGVVTTVGVAWGLAAFVQPHNGNDETSTRISLDGPTRRISTVLIHVHYPWCDYIILIPAPMEFAEAKQSSLREQYTANGAPEWSLDSIKHGLRSYPSHPGRARGLVIEGYGWPVTALWSGWISDDQRPGVYKLFAGQLTPIGLFNPNSFYNAEGCIVLPTHPIWPGFLINTLFDAAIWFGLFFAMGRIRRFIRTRRGRCPRCGYDLRGEFNEGCSECGWGRNN